MKPETKPPAANFQISGMWSWKTSQQRLEFQAEVTLSFCFYLPSSLTKWPSPSPKLSFGPWTQITKPNTPPPTPNEMAITMIISVTPASRGGYEPGICWGSPLGGGGERGIQQWWGYLSSRICGSRDEPMKMESSTELTACTWWTTLLSSSDNSMAPNSSTRSLNLFTHMHTVGSS